MAPRASARFASTSSTPTAPRALSAIPQPIAADTPQLAELRKQWKWAAVSQFLYTFAPLVNLETLSLTQVEIDLTFGTMDVLPRLMQRLLYTLTQDRKISLDNWQTALRKQYLRRDPEANPIGWELQATNTLSRKVSSEPELFDPSAPGGTGDDTGQLSSTHATTAEVVGETIHTEESVKEEPQSNGFDDGTIADHVDGEVESSLPPQKDWVELSMLEKLESIHTLMEWHFHTPVRLRSMMRSDDEQATWRIEPIGFNSKHDAYWLIGLDRLWIQRAPPKVPRKILKRKAPPIGGSRKAKSMRAGENDRSEQTATSSSKRKNTKSTDNSVSRQRETAQSSRKGKAKEEPPANPRARAAKSEAKVKLDEQAKQLAAAKAEMRALGRRKSMRDVWPEESPSAKRVVGTRVSRRLRGEEDDDWQPIPPEWLAGEPDAGIGRSRTSKRPANGTAEVVEIRKTGLESDDDSELTELSDIESNSPNEDNLGSSRRSRNSKEAVTRNEVASMESDNKNEDSEAFEPPEPNEPDVWPLPNFVEWETVCVTLAEWETVAAQFEHATHYAEKALYKVLAQDIVPSVTSMLREIEKQRQKEEAVVHRKRSSRIAVKEGEKEEARLAAQRKAEEEERLSRARRAEARAKKEEEDRLKRELAREQRRKEREEREERMRTGKSQDGGSSHDGMMVDVVHDDGFARGHHLNGTKFAPSQINYEPKGQHHKGNGKGKGKEHHSNGDDWELDCQICGTKGINRDDGLPLMSCGICGKWQHIPCHDAEDIRTGRPKRNWDVVDFTCKSCRSYPQSRPSLPPAATEAYSSDTRQSAHSKSLDTRFAVNGHSTFLRSHPSSTTSHPYPIGNTPHHIQPQPSVTFAHYQPLRHGFSSHVPTPERQHHGYDYRQQMVTSNGRSASSSGPLTAIAAQETAARQDIAGQTYVSTTQPYYNSPTTSGYSNVGMPPTQNIRTNGSPAHLGLHTYDSAVDTNAHQHISGERSRADGSMGYGQAAQNAAGSFTAYPQYSGVHQYPKVTTPQYHQSYPRG